MKKTDCKLLGTISKPHGYKGQMVLISENDLPEDFENWESVFVEIDGLLVPFFFKDINHTHNDSAIIQFEDLENIDLIGELIHCKVYSPAKKGKKTKNQSVDLNNLEGYKVIDKHHGDIGQASEILDYNQNLILRILKGKKEILIPIQESIIENVDSKSKTIFINAPEGLIDIYLE
jgi:16S rRNA processing protein RimM